MTNGIGPARFSLATIAASTVLVFGFPLEALAQRPAISASDSTDILEEAKESQRAFESYRESRIPATAVPYQGQCDERIGPNICIWFGGDEETNFPPEPPETDMARGDLIGELTEAADRIADPWITGQLVQYLVEAGNFRRAEAVAEECGLVDEWWCHALRGYVLHILEDFVAAEAAFRQSVALMPEGIYESWITPRYVFTVDGEDAFEDLEPEARARQWEQLWLFSDPLFLVEGNDRLTEHFTRLVAARNSEDAGHPGMYSWDRFNEETLIRYGRHTGYSRTRATAGSLLGGFGDTRSVIAHHDPNSRGYLFPEQFVTAPADIPPESWITAPREARTWYAPPYAPDFSALETQVGRFRRGEDMFVVAAYRPLGARSVASMNAAAPPANANRPDPFARGQPTAAPRSAPVRAPSVQLRGSVQSGLFLFPEAGGDPVILRSEASEGVFTTTAPNGRYVGSIEVFAEDEQRAWRARQGVNQATVARGLVSVSDLLILAEGAPIPGSLDEAIPNVRAGVRVRGDEQFVVLWEVYGLQVREPVQVTLGFTPGRPGFLRRVGEFVGILEPDRPVEITFADAGPEAVQTEFRAVTLRLPDLAAGEYTLHLRLDLPGREPVIASRPITVEG